MNEQYLVRPLDAPPDVTVRVPGSKSLTNRALVAAALAEGTSEIVGALEADDTEAMEECLTRLGARFGRDGDRLLVTGAARIADGPITLDARQSGTTARFVLPVLGLGAGTYVLDGSEQLRARPMGPVLDAVRALGAEVEGDRLPVTVHASGLAGGRVAVSGELSSQFVSGLLLAAPSAATDLEVDVVGAPVSRPYLDLTVGTMRAFGATVEQEGHERFVVRANGYRPARYVVEPDASSASYFLAAAAITGGRVTVDGIGADSPQGDADFADVLSLMGAKVTRSSSSTTVVGGALHGIDVDLGDLPDMAPTLAAVAVFADSPTRVRGVAIIRGHESDRIAGVVTELRRCGISSRETEDGFVIEPGAPQPATVDSYGDHRMAMSFALLGLRSPGIAVADPGCVGKTFPTFWSVLESLRG